MGRLSTAPARACGKSAHLATHRLRSISVTGGFLDGASFDLADGLNCLIGARGTGKTTVLELSEQENLAHIRKVGGVGFDGLQSLEDLRRNWNRLMGAARLTPEQRSEAVRLFVAKVGVVPGTQVRRPTVSMTHERYKSSHLLLRELVLVHVDADDGESFDTLLTRVPGIGEEIGREERTYRAVRVRHEPVDDDGRARLGWHALVDAELQPEDDAAPTP